MQNKFKKGDSISISQRILNKRKLLKPFLEKYDEPVLVHATFNEKLFTKIVRDGKIAVPNENYNEGLFIERKLGIYPSIFFSLGFTYSTSYDFKYNFIFDLGLLKNARYYQRSLAYQAYKFAALYWDENDPGMLERLSSINRTCSKVVRDFYNKKYNGKNKSIFAYWNCEKEMFDLLNSYPKRNEFFKEFKKMADKAFVKYPNSIRKAKEQCMEEFAPEIIVKKDISLKNNPSFLGFYVMGKIPKKINSILKENYPDKILFDGKKIKTIN